MRFCGGEISPDSAVTTQQPQAHGASAAWYLSGRWCGCERQKALFHPGLLWPHSLSQLEQREENTTAAGTKCPCKTTDLPNFKHLLIKTMPRKQVLFFLISIETLSHASFLTHAQTTASVSAGTSKTYWF